MYSISLYMNVQIEDALRPLFQTQKYSNTLAQRQKLKPILSCFIDNATMAHIMLHIKLTCVV